MIKNWLLDTPGMGHNGTLQFSFSNPITIVTHHFLNTVLIGIIAADLV